MEDARMQSRFPEVFALPPADKLRLLEELWDSLAANPEDIPVPDWQLEELQRRRAEYENDLGNAMSWEEAKEAIRKGQANARTRLPD